MRTQQQNVSTSSPPGPRPSRRARVHTLIEATAAMFIVFMLTGYAIIKILQSQFANRWIHT